MTIPHVTAGEVARAAEQNALIDEVNDHTNTLDLNAGTLGEHTSRLDTLEVSAAHHARYEAHAKPSIPEGLTVLGYDTAITTTADVTANAAMDAFTVHRAGIYIIMGGLRWTASAGAGARAAFIWRNGANGFGSALAGADTNPGTAMSDNSASTAVWLSAGDYVQFGVFQNSGGPLSCDGTTINYIAITRIGAQP